MANKIPESVRFRGKTYKIVSGFRSTKAKANEYAKALRIPGKSGALVREYNGMYYVYFR